MIVAMVLAMQDAPPEAPPAEIVVIGTRLKAWRGSFRSHGGRISCRTTKSTGDAAIDAIGCDSMVACLDPVAVQFDALAEATRDKAERARRLDALLQTRVPCLNETRQAGIARLAAERSRR
jgi:hypothetical protein